jgi:hypothetical protein
MGFALLSPSYRLLEALWKDANIMKKNNHHEDVTI